MHLASVRRQSSTYNSPVRPFHGIDAGFELYLFYIFYIIRPYTCIECVSRKIWNARSSFLHLLIIRLFDMIRKHIVHVDLYSPPNFSFY